MVHREGWEAYQLATRERRVVGNRFLIGHASLVKYPAFAVILIGTLPPSSAARPEHELSREPQVHREMSPSLYPLALVSKPGSLLIPVFVFTSEGTRSSSNLCASAQPKGLSLHSRGMWQPCW